MWRVEVTYDPKHSKPMIERTESWERARQYAWACNASRAWRVVLEEETSEGTEFIAEWLNGERI